MDLSSGKYDEYWQRGWTVVESVFSREEADAIGTLATNCVNRSSRSRIRRTPPTVRMMVAKSLRANFHLRSPKPTTFVPLSSIRDCDR